MNKSTISVNPSKFKVLVSLAIIILSFYGCNNLDYKSDIIVAFENNDSEILEELIPKWLNSSPAQVDLRLYFLVDKMISSDYLTYVTTSQIIRQNVERFDEGRIEKFDSITSRDLLVRGVLFTYIGDQNQALESFKKATEIDPTNKFAQRTYHANNLFGVSRKVKASYDASFSGNLYYPDDEPGTSMIPADRTFEISGYYRTIDIGKNEYAGEITDWMYIYSDNNRNTPVGWAVCITSGSVVINDYNLIKLWSLNSKQLSQKFSSLPYDATGKYFVLHIIPENGHSLFIPR